MYANRDKGLTVDFGTKRVYINGAHIDVSDAATKEVLFRRAACYPDWYDEKHKRIMDAVHELESALVDACCET